MSRVAIFGGSFNPPHIGHEALCLILLEACEIDEVWIVPTYRHYFGKELVDFAHRFAMCERMAAPFGERVKVCAVERDLDAKTSRMLDTLQELQRRNPEHRFRLAIGADILLETDKWYRWDKVAQLAPPLVFRRKGYAGGVLPSPPEVSSTQIREALAAGHSALPLISPAVQAYISEHGLYQ
jgi:nicotinate-nucleotide adenylyltransferase